MKMDWLKMWKTHSESKKKNSERLNVSHSISFEKVWHLMNTSICNIKLVFCFLLPEINAGRALIEIRLVDFTDATLWKKYANKWWIIALGPIFYWKWQWICVLLGWIGEFQKSVHGYLWIQSRAACQKRKSPLNCCCSLT